MDVESGDRPGGPTDTPTTPHMSGADVRKAQIREQISSSDPGADPEELREADGISEGMHQPAIEQ